MGKIIEVLVKIFGNLQEYFVRFFLLFIILVVLQTCGFWLVAKKVEDLDKKLEIMIEEINND